MDVNPNASSLSTRFDLRFAHSISIDISDKTPSIYFVNFPLVSILLFRGIPLPSFLFRGFLQCSNFFLGCVLVFCELRGRPHLQIGTRGTLLMQDVGNHDEDQGSPNGVQDKCKCMKTQSCLIVSRREGFHICPSLLHLPVIALES